LVASYVISSSTTFFSSGNRQAKGNLLAFCKKQTEGYEGVEIKDFQGR
jgi:hypothetical protein